MISDFIQRNSIERSIEDVIDMLDASPIQRDMVGYHNNVQIGNRAHNAHLGIERGFKALVRFAQGTNERGHSLPRLFLQLERVDKDTADFLALAFRDAVDFYGYNTNANGFRHLKSIHTYFENVGGENAFNVYRYWVTEIVNDPSMVMPPISLDVHRELLCAIARLIGLGEQQVVSERVDWAIFHALSPTGRHMWFTEGESDDEKRRRANVLGYMAWFNEHHSSWRDARSDSSWRDTLRDAVISDFSTGDDEFVSSVVKTVFEELKESADPAVRYFTGRMGYLSRGSQPRFGNLAVEMEWSAEGRDGMIKTPAGTVLGHVNRYADGGWGIRPRGRVPFEIAEALADAKRYLIERLTHRIKVRIGDESRSLRLIEDHDSFVPTSTRDWTGDENYGPESYNLEFWDDQHGLNIGQNITAKLHHRDSSDLVSVLKGKITSVEGHRATVVGNSWFDVDSD